MLEKDTYKVDSNFLRQQTSKLEIPFSDETPLNISQLTPSSQDSDESGKDSNSNRNNPALRRGLTHKSTKTDSTVKTVMRRLSVTLGLA